MEVTEGIQALQFMTQFKDMVSVFQSSFDSLTIEVENRIRLLEAKEDYQKAFKVYSQARQ